MTHVRPRALTPETGAMLRAARKGRGWTLAKASDEIGCHLSHLSRMETAKAAPSVAIATDIVFAYRLNQDQARALMGESVPRAGRSKPSRGKAAA